MRKPSGESAAFYCRGRRPDAPAAAPKASSHVRRIRSRLFLPPAGEGGIRRSPARRMTEEGERDRQQTVNVRIPPRLRSFPHGGPAAFSLSGRPCGRHPPPLGGNGRGRFGQMERSGAPYRVNADSPDGSLRFCAAAWNAGDGVPYRAYADLPQVESSHCHVLPGRRGRRPLPWGTAAISADIARLRLFFGASLFFRLTQKCCNCAI